MCYSYWYYRVYSNSPFYPGGTDAAVGYFATDGALQGLIMFWQGLPVRWRAVVCKACNTKVWEDRKRG